MRSRHVRVNEYKDNIKEEGRKKDDAEKEVLDKKEKEDWQCFGSLRQKK